MKSLRVVFDDLVAVNGLSSSDSSHVIWISRLTGEQCGDRLRTLRKRLGMTREDLARAVGISAHLVAKAETDPSQITLRDLVKMCDTLCALLDQSLRGGEPNSNALVDSANSAGSTDSDSDEKAIADQIAETKQPPKLEDFAPRPDDQPSGIRRWSAAVLGLASTILIVYGAFQERPVIILGFIGIVFAIPVAVVVHQATLEAESSDGSRFYRNLSRILTGFALSYLMLLAVGIFYSVLMALIHFIQPVDAGSSAVTPVPLPTTAPAKALVIEMTDIKYDITGWQRASTDDYLNQRKVSTVIETVTKTVVKHEIWSNFNEDDFTPGIQPDVRSLNPAVRLKSVWGPFRSEKRPNTDVYDKYVYVFDISEQPVGKSFTVKYQDLRFNTHQQQDQWWYAAVIDYPTQVLRMSFKFPSDRQSDSSEVWERNYSAGTARKLSTAEFSIRNELGWDRSFEILNPKVGYGYAYHFAWERYETAATSSPAIQSPRREDRSGTNPIQPLPTTNSITVTRPPTEPKSFEVNGFSVLLTPTQAEPRGRVTSNLDFDPLGWSDRPTKVRFLLANLQDRVDPTSFRFQQVWDGGGRPQVGPQFGHGDELAAFDAGHNKYVIIADGEPTKLPGSILIFMDARIPVQRLIELPDIGLKVGP